MSCDNCGDPDDPEFDEMYVRSGRVTSEDPATALLYLLLENGEVSPKDLEMRVRQITQGDTEDFERFHFSNGYLGQYAQDLVDRLRELQKSERKDMQ